MASHCEQPMATASLAGDCGYAVVVAQSDKNNPSAPIQLQFPTSKPMQASIPSVASRKALLLEKLQGNQGSTPSPPKSQPWTPPVLSQPDWSKLVLERRERRDTLASTVSGTTLPAKLSPMPTGSTVASTAVEPAGLGLASNGFLDPGARHSGVSRVRLAVLAINSMDKSVENAPAWRVGRNEETPPSRSWSRMSGAGKFGEDKLDVSWIPVDEEEEPSLVQSSSSETLTSEPSLMIDTKNLSMRSRSASIVKETGDGHADTPGEVPEDTHPPHMVSPRTGLAYVILPPWARRRSSVDIDTQPKEIPTPVTKAPPQPILPDMDTEEQDEVAPLPPPRSEKRSPLKAALTSTDKASPRAVSTPSPAPKIAPRRNAPIVLRGAGKASTSNPTSAQPSTTVPISPRQGTPLPQSARPRVQKRSASLQAPPSSFPRRLSTLQPPTVFWTPPERLRQRRASFSMPTIPDEPLALKAQNPVPLRKVNTKPAPKPMRFSVAF